MSLYKLIQKRAVTKSTKLTKETMIKYLKEIFEYRNEKRNSLR